MAERPKRPIREAVSLRSNGRLIRRAAIRHAITGRYGRNGVSGLEQLLALLWEEYGIKTNKTTVSGDLKAMGAVRAYDPNVPGLNWYVLPSYYNGLEDARMQISPEIVESEAAYRVASHVVDLFPVGRFIYCLCEHRSGPLVAYWLSLLSWPELIAVQETSDLVLVHCLTHEGAKSVAGRLIGLEQGTPIMGGEEGGSEDEAEDDDED